MTQQRAGAGQAKYKIIAADLRAKIESGEYPVDARLPTHEQLMERYSVALNTAREALAVLRDEGRVETHQGVGTVVVEPPTPEPSPQFTAIMQQIADVAGEVRRLSERTGALERWQAESQQPLRQSGP
jgi:DNA-binding GntR family transcriptional regulator